MVLSVATPDINTTAAAAEAPLVQLKATKPPKKKPAKVASASKPTRTTKRARVRTNRFNPEASPSTKRPAAKPAAKPKTVKKFAVLKNPVPKAGDGIQLKENDVIFIDWEGIQESQILQDLKNGWYHVELLKARGFHHQVKLEGKSNVLRWSRAL